MKKIVISFCLIALAVAVLLVVKDLLADESVIRNVFQGIINWVTTSFGTPDMNIF